MADLPQNQNYNSPVGSAINTSIKLANTFGRGQMARSTRPQQSNVSTPVLPRNNVSSALEAIKQLGTITTPYGGSTRYESYHPGIDVANKIGTPIPVATPGKVISKQTGYKQGDKGFGNRVVIEDASGNRYYYSHLNQDYVKLGQNVPAGSYIGTMGNTGSTYSLHGGTGAHLDFRIKNAYGKYVNPMSFYNRSM